MGNSRPSSCASPTTPPPHTTDGGVYGRDYTLSVDLPAMGSRMYRITPEAPHPEAAQASARKAAAQKRKATIAAKQNSKK